MWQLTESSIAKAAASAAVRAAVAAAAAAAPLSPPQPLAPPATAPPVEASATPPALAHSTHTVLMPPVINYRCAMLCAGRGSTGAIDTAAAIRQACRWRHCWWHQRPQCSCCGSSACGCSNQEWLLCGVWCHRQAAALRRLHEGAVLQCSLPAGSVAHTQAHMCAVTAVLFNSSPQLLLSTWFSINW